MKLGFPHSQQYNIIIWFRQAVNSYLERCIHLKSKTVSKGRAGSCQPSFLSEMQGCKEKAHTILGNFCEEQLQTHIVVQ